MAIPLSQATRAQGKPEDFLYTSVRVLRELAWQLEDEDEKDKVDSARDCLEDVYLSSLADLRGKLASHLYRDLLCADDRAFKPGSSLRQKLLDFVDKKEPFEHRPSLDLPAEYGPRLHQLFQLADGHGSKKMVERVAKTDLFPRRSLLPPAFNSWFLYVTTGLYCLARLLVVAVGISSLRAMPEGVYNTTWAEYIPAI
jgi:hypothetical protein